MATDTELAWCAGFFDGEGTVGYYRQRPRNGKVYAILAASVTQIESNQQVLEHFQQIVGMGKISKPYENASLPNGKPVRRLIFATEEVFELLKLLAPYLQAKKSSDFRMAVTAHTFHTKEITKEDIERTSKLGCPECKYKEWNGVFCTQCGYMT